MPFYRKPAVISHDGDSKEINQVTTVRNFYANVCKRKKIHRLRHDNYRRHTHVCCCPG